MNKNMLEGYQAQMTLDINSELHKFKKKDGSIIRYFATGGVVYANDIDTYVTINKFDSDTGIYSVKMKNQELEERMKEIDDEEKEALVYHGVMIHGYHQEFLESMQVDTLMIEALPDEMRIEILS